MLAPPPVTRYSPVGASYTAAPGIGLAPTSCRASKMPSAELPVWAGSAVTNANKETAASRNGLRMTESAYHRAVTWGRSPTVPELPSFSSWQVGALPHALVPALRPRCGIAGGQGERPLHVLSP